MSPLTRFNQLPAFNIFFNVRS